MKYLFTLSLYLLFFNIISATHIIGGSMSYNYSGNDTYTIRLEVLRDCASAGASFDNPASIGIFDKDGKLFKQLFVTIGTIEVLTDDPANICLFPPNICVERTFYQTLVTLPAIEGGYTIAYQRCCRSNVIVNLENPSENGMTFHTHINTDLHNSGPAFVEKLPYAVYINTPFVFNASGLEPDGDSLAYALTSPFYGGDLTNIQPQPPAAPPYVQGAYKSPYSVENIMGGEYPLTIHPVTGVMTSIPQTTGFFQIAYSVKEYRGGTLIGTYYREFAFAVIFLPPNLSFEVSGLVLINDSTALDAGSVQIFQKDFSTDSLSLYDEQEIGVGASYSFTNIPAGVFYLRATVDPTSVYYNLYLSTYLRDAYFWYEATPVNHCDNSPFLRNILLINADSFNIPTMVHPGFTNQDLLINIYPNPVTDIFTIDVKALENKTVKYEVLDVNGMKIRSGRISTNHSEQINAGELPCGVYFIKVENDGRYVVGRFVKGK